MDKSNESVLHLKQKYIIVKNEKKIMKYLTFVINRTLSLDVFFVYDIECNIQHCNS